MTAQGKDGKSEGERVRIPIIREGLAAHLPDIDPDETTEWLESFDAVVDAAGQQRARYLMLRMLQRARERHVGVPSLTSTDYVNTIPTDREPWFPGDEDAERTYRRWIRWNAAITVHRAQRPGIGVGGHISSYASSATLYEVGFNHFFRGKDHPGGGDQVFIQGHASPGIYARAYLEGRLSEDRLDGFRQELSHGGPGHGLPSYPHPRLMPDFWEFPTVSMGLGPMNAIMQARFNRYLGARGFTDTSDQHVWAFLGDGEMDEPESRGLIHIAAGEGLDNLTFVVNCNLQRLDGPVRGNGKIIQELESFFLGAGWNVIKVIWGREWDGLLARDRDGALVNLMNTTLDGDYQTYKANDGAFVREHFFGRDPRTKELVEPMSDAEIWNLKRGGHDYRKVYAAYAAATAAPRPADGHPGQDDQGLRAGRALRGPQRDPPDEEADAGRPQGVPRLPAHPDLGQEARGEPVPAAVLPPGRGRPGDPLPARAPAPGSAARCRRGGSRRSRWCCPATRSTRSSARARASRRWPRRWPSSGCCASW